MVYDESKPLHKAASRRSSKQHTQHKDPAASNFAFGQKTPAERGDAGHRQQIGRIDELEILAT